MTTDLPHRKKDTDQHCHCSNSPF